MSEPRYNYTGLGLTLQKPVDLKEPILNDEGFSLNEVDPGLTVLKEISVDFKNAGLNVIKIEQLNNHHLWQKYMNEKKIVEDRKPQDPAFELNEKYLYHGTSAKKEYICQEGLDARLSKTGRRFGRGIYFSDNPQKCCNYANKGGKNNFIIVARVILGCSKVFAKGSGDKFLTREPEKKQPYKGWRFYDSVIGCPKDYREFVIYRNDRSLVEFIVTYSKDHSSTTLPVSRDDKPPTSTSSSIPPSKSLHETLNRPFYTRKNLATNDEEDSDTTDEDEKTGSSESESSDQEKNEIKTDGKEYSSDSSAELNNDDEAQCVKYKNKSTNKQTDMRKSGENILAEKKREFMLKTGERRQHVIESFLSTTGLDVDKAVNLFLENDKKRREMERKQKMLEITQEEKSAHGARDICEDSASSSVNPIDEPEKWRRMKPEDKEAIIDGLVDNFLTVIGLEDNADNRKQSRKIIFSCNYDLDSSIVSYYETL